MKGYKYWILILLVAIFFVSIYMLYSNNLAIEQAYKSSLTTARDFRSQKIMVDAEQHYADALEAKPSIGLNLEVGEMYVELNELEKAEKWGEKVLETYPKEPAAYEYMMRIYIAKAKFGSCFELYDRMLKRDVASETVSETITGIEYTYSTKSKYNDVGMWTGGYCPVQRNGQWCFINSTGSLIGEYKYSKVGAFVAGMAPVVTTDGEAYFIDSQTNRKKTVADIGNIEDIGMLVEGIYSLYDGSSWSFYDQENNYLFGGFEDATAFVNGVAAVKENAKWKLIDRTGANLTGKQYNDIIADERSVAYNNERAFVYIDNGYKMIDSSGAVMGKLTFKNAKPFYSSSYAAVCVGDKWGFVDADGQLQIPTEYEDARSFINGFAAVKKDGKWGFIGLDGSMLIEPEFDDARDFNTNGSAFVLKEDKWTLLSLYKYNH